MSPFRQILSNGLAAGILAVAAPISAHADAAGDYHHKVRPLLENYCFDCHADGANKGNVTLDEFKSDADTLQARELWHQVLKNLRAGLMPPPKKSQPTAAEKELITEWIKRSVFEADPRNPDPGRVTLRRLNRGEYQNTIRDLVGVDFDAQTAFPADDTGHGFDNIGDVLTLPPMLLEKYVLAANQIISRAVPTAPRVIPEKIIAGADFAGSAESRTTPRRTRRDRPEPLALSYYQPASVANTFTTKVAGTYQLDVALMITERYVDDAVDQNKCRLIFRVDGKELLQEEYAWAGGRTLNYRYDLEWPAGVHELSFELQPLTPEQPQTRSLAMQITSVKVSGPRAEEHWVTPQNYARFFPKPVPADRDARRAYARELLGRFARRAYRRPADDATLDRLTALAERVYTQSGKTFEAGIAQGMVAILASPRFLFREERAEPAAAGDKYPFVDEFSLATRLSYFLWSSLPDEELLQLAERGQLRKNLSAQVARLLKSEKSAALVHNFVGQWLRTRDIEHVPIEARFVLAREEKFDPETARNQARFEELRAIDEPNRSPAEQQEFARLRDARRKLFRQPLRAELTGELRAAMRRETEKSFDYLLRQDRSLLELLDADYTFLNEPLARHYGIPGVTGAELRLVKLPAGSPRGGILTQGTMLGVTSNPTRTSPVKRGVFVLENILGTPPPPPPVNVPPLESAANSITNHAPSLRETLAVHRENALCASCHNRMDPIGLAFENFNAMGMWRDAEYGVPIDATGSLITGETFQTVRDLKQTLVKNHYRDFYRTITEKMLTYALGRGLEYYDVETCDQIEARVVAAKGKPSELLAGIIWAAPFQRLRPAEPAQTEKSPRLPQRADNRSTAHESKPIVN